MIPKSFKIGALTITTEIDRTMCQERRICGEARYPQQTIVLDPTLHELEGITQAHYHEKIHWILYVMNRHDLRTDEAFVDVFAHLLMQADSTSTSYFTSEDLKP